MKKDDENKPPGGGQHHNQLPKRVALLYSEVKREYFPTEVQYLTEKDAKRDAELVAKHLSKLGVETILYPGTPEALKKLFDDRPEVVINLVDSIRGNEYLAATIPAMMEFLNIPFTGVGMLGGSLDYNKFIIKKLLEQNGIPVPRYQLFNTPSDQLDPTMHFPLISKLNEIHGAVEINKDAVSENEKHLRERLKFLIKTYDQPVLAEEFIAGREMTAMLLQGLNTKVYLAEKVFNKPKEKYVFATFEDQWLEGDEEGFHYQKYHDPLLQEYVKKAFEVTKMADYGKFDIRIDASGRYYFIDANSNPAFGPRESDCAIANILSLYGVSFEQILGRLLLNTVRDAQGKNLLPIIENGEEEK